MTIIYKFSFEDFSYIGSTNSPLINRIKEHYICIGRDRCKNIKLYKYCKEKDIRDILEDCFEILETSDTNLDRLERLQLEQKHIDIHKPNLNMRNAWGRRHKKKQ